jgi:hypothetical protein
VLALTLVQVQVQVQVLKMVVVGVKPAFAKDWRKYWNSVDEIEPEPEQNHQHRYQQARERVIAKDWNYHRNSFVEVEAAIETGFEVEFEAEAAWALHQPPWTDSEGKNLSLALIPVWETQGLSQ